jgi:tetratricopeptide (TPR) repeat protein
MRAWMVVGLLVVTTPAVAVEPDPARDHYERGLSKYNIAEFDAAIDEFKQSYELSKAPRLLFNIAQAYRLKKDWERALYFYNTYLRNDPHAPNRDDVEARIDEMKQHLDEQQAQASGGAPSGGTSSGVASGGVARGNQALTMSPKPSSPDRARGRRLEVAGFVTGGIGVAAAAVGGGMLGLSSSDAGKIRGIVMNGSAWDASAQATYDEGTRSQAAGIALLAVGGAAVIAGIVVATIGARERHAK